MGRGISPARLGAGVLVLLLVGSAATRAGDPRAIERFRAAAVLQDRALYDLAAAEFAAIARDFAGDSLADRASLQRGICLFQLGQYADAEMELAPLRAGKTELSPDESQQLLAYFGLTEYNLSRTADSPRREKLLETAVAALAEHLGQFPDSSLAPQTAFYHAEALYARGQLDAAIAAYRALVTKYSEHPQRAEVTYALGVALQEHGDFADAIASFSQLEREFSQHPSRADAHARRGDALLALSESQLAAREPAAAERTAEQLLAEYPESALVPPALALIAQVQFDQADLAAAEASLDRCLQRSTHAEVSTEARLFRARVRHQRGNFAGALADANAVLAAVPSHPEARHVRGLAEMALGKPADAIKSYEQIVRSTPNYARIDNVLYDLAWAYQESNEPAVATATFSRLAQSHPESKFAAECHFRVGESQYAAREYAAAAKSYFAACESASSPELLGQALHKMAWCCFERRQFGAAEEAFDRQVALEHEQIETAGGKVDASTPLTPLAADAMWLVVECRYQQQQFTSALGAYENAVEQRSASESLRAMVSLHAVQSAAATQDWARAATVADRALGDYPQSQWTAETRCERGFARLELGRLDEATQDFAAVAAADQGVLQARSELGLGKVQLARKDHDAAVRTFFKVAYGRGGTEAPEPFHAWQAEAIFLAAGALEATGRTEAARKLYEELVDDYPSGARTALARQSLERIFRR